MTESPYILLNECRDRYQKIVAREAAEAAREQYEKYAEILKIPDILTRLDNMENKLEELERKIADGDKINETEEQPQPDEINDPVSRFKPY